MVILVFVVGAIAVLAGLGLLIDTVVRRRVVTLPAPRPDGLGDNLRLGIGINLHP